MKDRTQFAIQQTHGMPLVEVSGEVDLTNVEQLEQKLEQAARADCGVVIVSLRDATYFDSSTIHVLLRFAERLSVNRQRLLLVAPAGGSPAKILSIAGISDALPMFESVEKATAAGREANGSPAT